MQRLRDELDKRIAKVPEIIAPMYQNVVSVLLSEVREAVHWAALAPPKETP